MRSFSSLLLLCSAALLSACSSQTLKPASDASTLDAVRERGYLRCGVSNGVPGFSSKDRNGIWSGLDVDFCRAVATAVLGDARQVRFVPLSSKMRFVSLQAGKVDLLARNSTVTQTRDTRLGLISAGINYFDGQGFMVTKELGIERLRELSGGMLCLRRGSNSADNAERYLQRHGLEYSTRFYDSSRTIIEDFENRRCDLISSDNSQLHHLRLRLSDPDGVRVLPEIISKEALGVLVRQGDNQWLNIVSWSLHAMITAEELGLSSGNIDHHMDDPRNSVQRFIDSRKGDRPQPHLSPDWAYKIVKQVGNYGESFERNLGGGSRFKIPRGLNALSSQGGLHYAPSFR